MRILINHTFSDNPNKRRTEIEYLISKLGAKDPDTSYIGIPLLFPYLYELEEWQKDEIYEFTKEILLNVEIDEIWTYGNSPDTRTISEFAEEAGIHNEQKTNERETDRFEKEKY